MSYDKTFWANHLGSLIGTAYIIVLHHLVAIPDVQFIPAMVRTGGNQVKFVQIPAISNHYK